MAMFSKVLKTKDILRPNKIRLYQAMNNVKKKENK